MQLSADQWSTSPRTLGVRSRPELLDSITTQRVQEAVAEKPFADIDTMWGEGIINSEQWVQIVYLTLRISAGYFSDEQSVTLIRKEEQQ
jgi:hypothetical protein